MNALNRLSPRSPAPVRPDPAARDSDRSALTLADLPPPGTARWVVSRKAAVVAGVRTGLITLDEALERYALSLDEFLCWKRLVDSYGIKGLRTTRIKEYRSRDRDRELAEASCDPTGSHSISAHEGPLAAAE